MATKLSRKAQLTKRGYARAERYFAQPLSNLEVGRRAFEDGYKAAMRDLRKIVAAVKDEVPDRHTDTLKDAIAIVRQRHVHTSIMLRRWLRPVR